MIVELAEGAPQLGREGLWVRHLVDNVYVLDNIPFYAYGIACNDEVYAEPVGSDLVFKGIRGRKGHSVYRVAFDMENLDSPNDINEFLENIKNFGCSFEGCDGRLFAIDVPLGVDVHSLYKYFQNGEDKGLWEFEEGHYGTRS
ncbi:DUF4265 domain-containing protein [Niveispirillum sp. SYP-B3756]|uniref:DUF4265 domain-containing protein n=1 Tax=Niveispirillum sp. SYP-B3756 TaxID=2662178 RepID=UPI002000557F|nr:DUF4265 domain-containing protein [Niveispirillum sp. SYP-B3756]